MTYFENILKKDFLKKRKKFIVKRGRMREEKENKKKEIHCRDFNRRKYLGGLR